IINATNTTINVAGIDSTWAILAFAQPNGTGLPHVASVNWGGPSLTSTTGNEGGGIEEDKGGMGKARGVASGDIKVVAVAGGGNYGLLAHAGDPTFTGVSGAGNASVTYNSGTLDVSGFRPRGILAWVDGIGSATVNTAAGTVINVSGNPFGHAAAFVFSSSAGATALTANVASLIKSVGPADPTDPVNLPTGIRANNSGQNAPIVVNYTGPGITTEGGNGVGILANSGSGRIDIINGPSSGPITSTGEFGSGIVATTGGNAINIVSGGSVMGGWQPDLTSVGPALGLPAAGVILDSTGGPATLTNNGSIGALSDRAVAGDPQVINNGTITGFVQFTGGDNSIINNGTFNLRHFADTTGGGRDTLRVAIADLGNGQNNSFTNNGLL